MKVKSLKNAYIDDINQRYQDKIRFIHAEKMSEEVGFSAGWDKAMATVKSHTSAGVSSDDCGRVEFEELRPAVKFLDQPLISLLEKVIEECCEVLHAYHFESEQRLAEELVDVQEACETALAKLTCADTLAKRRFLRRLVIHKNELRDYYKAGGDDK